MLVFVFYKKSFPAGPIYDSVVRLRTCLVKHVQVMAVVARYKMKSLNYIL